MARASAPGKVILFGEHSVVYGEPALAGAIDRRVHVAVDRRSDEELRITSTPPTGDDYPYVRKAVELAFEYLGWSSGLDIVITSQLPPASGLGSSAAVSVATILAVSELCGERIGKPDLARLGHNVEKEVQGAASITDSSTTTFGGVLFIKPKMNVVEEVEAPSALPLVVGYTGKSSSTKELVELVRGLRERNEEIVEPIIRSMGRIAVSAKKALLEGEGIGELMNLNHGLLEALGVGTLELSRYVYAARAAGAEGAKITGAGGGGCMVAYAPDRQDEVARAIEREGGVAMKLGIDLEGARVEES